MGESGFSLSPKQRRVLAPKGEKEVFEEASGDQKTNLTVLAVIGAEGTVPSPMIIYPRKRINPIMSEEFPVEYVFSVGKSDSGWISYGTFYEYMTNSFNDWLSSNNVQRPVIVWTDWHKKRNNFLAKTLNEQGIIIYGLPPNMTHLLQPLDVFVFGPLKKDWSKMAKEWEEANNDESITQVNFAKVFLPVYYKYVTPQNIRSGFSKCGLVPFNKDSPNYLKLKVGPAQRASDANIYEGINQGMKIKRSIQTEAPHLLNRAIQIDPILQVTASQERKDEYRYEGSLRDLILDYILYSELLDHYNSMPFHRDKPVPDYNRSLVLPFAASSLEQLTSSPSPVPSTSRVSPIPGSNSTPDQEQSTSTLPISPFFHTCNFYPERRPGKGPKKLNTVLDRIYAISSPKMVEKFKRQRGETDRKEEEKKKRRLDN